MARPNLSFEHLAIVLAALGGCAKAAEPASVKSDKAQESASAATPITAPSAVATATATPTPTPSASAGAAAPGRGKDKGGATGQASCGAGSCTADMKKK